jgi:type IV pilus assembly protein PilA
MHMLRKLRKSNEKGFTLIELMIVIAIIGILAAIAIPNFIEYRNKGYCSATENDAKSVAAAVADYFSNPTRQSVGTADIDIPTSYGNEYRVAYDADTDVVTIEVDDGSGRCPEGGTYTTYIGGTEQASW